VHPVKATPTRKRVESAPGPECSNHFLQLPDEIRNKIYQYALTAESRQLFYRDWVGSNSIPEEVKGEINNVDNIWKVTAQKCVDTYHKHKPTQGAT
jgi:hypothetical protein